MESSEFNLDKATDEQLLALGKDDLEKSPSIQILISRYTRIIRIKAAKMKKYGNNSDIELEDLISEGFLGLLSAIRYYNSQRGSFNSFANTCIANRIKSAVMNTNTTVSIDYDYDFEQLEDEQISTEDLIIDKEENIELSDKLANILSETENSVLELYLKQCSYSKIAKTLNISEKSVDNALQRARQKLRNFMTK